MKEIGSTALRKILPHFWCFGVEGSQNDLDARENNLFPHKNY